MKKSSAVALMLLGSAGLLAGCNSEPDVQTGVYETVEQCKADSKVVREKSDQCETSYKAALEDNQKNAPAFKDVKDCEDEFGPGKCQVAPPQHTAQQNNGGGSSQSVFIPLMMGYMMGQNSHQYDRDRYSTAVAPQAVYRSRSSSGAFVNAGGGFVSQNVGAVKVSPRGEAASYSPAKQSTVKTTTMARGGFGGRVSVSS